MLGMLIDTLTAALTVALLQLTQRFRTITKSDRSIETNQDLPVDPMKQVPQHVLKSPHADKYQLNSKIYLK